MIKLIRVFTGSGSYRFLSKSHVAKTEYVEWLISFLEKPVTLGAFDTGRYCTQTLIHADCGSASTNGNPLLSVYLIYVKVSKCFWKLLGIFKEIRESVCYITE